MLLTLFRDLADSPATILRLSLVKSDGTPDNIQLTSDKEVKFYTSTGAYDPIPAITV